MATVATMLLGNADSAEMDCMADITANLTSLQFESALSDNELQTLYIRKNAQALTVTACAQAVYFVSIMNEAR